MSSPGPPTFDQLRVFLAVVDAGSFAGAGRRLNRAVSVISYGVANLEAQLGILLFERQGTRKPKLTEAGRAVLMEARGVAQTVDALQAKVKGLLDGLEAEVGLAIDVMLPARRLGEVARAFASAYPTVTLRLYVETLGAVPALVLQRIAVLGVSGPLSVPPEGLDMVSAGAVQMAPVAAPTHPLAKLTTIPPGSARHHIQLVLTDRSPMTEGRDFSVLSPRTWRLADLGAKHALLREGVGWGNMPLWLIETDLADGKLVRLDMPEQPGGKYRLGCVWRRDAPPGPAASWLMRQFVDQPVCSEDLPEMIGI